MDALAFLPLGFFVGMAHAVEADHLAAVAAMTSRTDGRRALIARGAVWGLGHTLSLFVICSTVVLFRLTVSGTVEASLELAVGAMILGLGGQVLWRLQGAAGRGPAARVRGHGKALAVGLVHGAAGSAGLLVLMVAATEQIWAALAAFAVFGLGSMLGMAALTAVASWPLMMVQRGAAALQNAVTGAIGAAALWVGGGLVIESLGALV
ncbi:MAG: hypothetical protein OEM24_10040 [Paracoccaceae bacterium]|nr:hypothetical protein [Paracoccaceae bacterium]